MKAVVRRIAYPPLLAARSRKLKKQYSTAEFDPDRWLLGQRGNDYEAHRRRVDSFLEVRGAAVLIAGCGTGSDIESWARCRPRSILGVDWFNYGRAWKLIRDSHAKRNAQMALELVQADLADMSAVSSDSIDIIASDAVFEHLQDLPKVLAEFKRVLRPGGLVYATFGPLWYGFGGDHVSGYDDVLNGYSHLLLTQPDWEDYLAGMGEFEHSEHDGRTWIAADLFSRLRAAEYLAELGGSGLERLFVQAIIDPRALTCLRDDKLRERLLAVSSELDLIVSGMTIIYRKP